MLKLSKLINLYPLKRFHNFSTTNNKTFSKVIGKKLKNDLVTNPFSYLLNYHLFLLKLKLKLSQVQKVIRYVKLNMYTVEPSSFLCALNLHKCLQASSFLWTQALCVKDRATTLSRRSRAAREREETSVSECLFVKLFFPVRWLWSSVQKSLQKSSQHLKQIFSFIVLWFKDLKIVFWLWEISEVSHWLFLCVAQH